MIHTSNPVHAATPKASHRPGSLHGALPWVSAREDAFDTAASGPLPSRLLPQSLPGSDLTDFWDDLFKAVKSTLRQVVEEAVGPSCRPQARDAVALGASVLQCVDALDTLHVTMAHEVSRRQQLSRRLMALEGELDQARTELLGTQAEERFARHMALHDSLTMLPNRRFFLECLQDALAQGRPAMPTLAVFYMDLDGFKAINDTHGHEVGDELLKIVAVRLSRAVRADDMVGRLGGDEFACLMLDVGAEAGADEGFDASQAQLRMLACKLLDAVSAPVMLGQRKFCISTSIGIATGSRQSASVESLLKSADAAMYRAKREQTGYAFFEDGVAAPLAAVPPSATLGL